MYERGSFQNIFALGFGKSVDSHVQDNLHLHPSVDGRE